MQMVSCKKLEICIEDLYKDFIIQILDKQGIKDFVCLPIIDGTKHGDEDFISNLERILIAIILEPDQVKPLVQEINLLLKEPQPLMILSDIEQIVFKAE
jgi:hypothetical protein